MINEADITRRFRNLVSTTQLVKKIAQHGYQGEYTEQAIYKLLDKYGIKPKTTRGGKSYFNKRNACTCIDRHIFELKEIAEQLEQQNQPQEESEWNVGYGRDDMSVTSREQLANDGVFGADENELYSYDDDEEDFTNESIFSFKDIVNEALSYLEEAFKPTKFDVKKQLPPVDLSNVVTTFHFDVDRAERRRDMASLIKSGNAGVPAFSFLVDRGDPRGFEIHTLTSKSIIFVQNARTKEVITLWPLKKPQITLYWDKLNKPYPVNDHMFGRIVRIAREREEGRK